MDTLDTVSTTDTLKQAFVDRLIADKDAMTARVAGLEAALRDMWASVTGGTPACGHDFTCVCVGDAVRATLSGGTAALDAHVAAAVDAERARIAKAVGALDRSRIAGVAGGTTFDVVYLSDVLAAIGGGS